MLNASGLYTQVSLSMRSKKKEGTEAVYQDSGVYHHAVSYCDIGHISADFRNDAYDFMARDKLDVKSEKRLRYFPRLRYAGSR